MQVKNAELLWWSKVRKQAGWLALMIMLAVFSGCATSTKVKPQPVTTVTNQGPSVARLEDGRQGFVIRENPSMDAESRDEFGRAVAMMNDGKNDKAIELLTKVIERSPGVTAPYINIAVAYMRTGKLELAEQHLKTALGLVPHHPVASNEYGLLLRKAGRFKEARDIYEKEIASFPDYLPVHRNLGILCDLYLNDPECALKQFEIYSEGMPADAQVKIWIAELRMRLGRAEKPKQEANPTEAKEAVKTAEKPKQDAKPAEAKEAVKTAEKPKQDAKPAVAKEAVKTAEKPKQDAQDSGDKDDQPDAATE
jgi:Tfp pilus assembly protein PilF